MEAPSRTRFISIPEAAQDEAPLPASASHPQPPPPPPRARDPPAERLRRCAASTAFLLGLLWASLSAAGPLVLSSVEVTVLPPLAVLLYTPPPPRPAPAPPPRPTPPRPPPLPGGGGGGGPPSDQPGHHRPRRRPRDAAAAAALRAFLHGTFSRQLTDLAALSAARAALVSASYAAGSSSPPSSLAGAAAGRGVWPGSSSSSPPRPPLAAYLAIAGATGGGGVAYGVFKAAAFSYRDLCGEEESCPPGLLLRRSAPAVLVMGLFVAFSWLHLEAARRAGARAQRRAGALAAAAALGRGGGGVGGAAAAAAAARAPLLPGDEDVERQDEEGEAQVSIR